MKRPVFLFISLAILCSLLTQTSNASTTVKSGAKCTKLNQKVTTATRSIYQCRKLGKKLVWRYIGKAPAPKPTSQMLWSEEFNGSAGSQPSDSNWTSLLGDGNEQLGLWRFGTGELEWNLPEAAATDGKGNMVITTTKSGGQWTSARYWTQGKVNFRYGKIEARIKMPTGSFNWPAFWMLGSNYSPPNQSFGTTGWPMSGEIDIAEGLWGNTDYRSTIHANVINTSTPWNGGGGLTAASNLDNPSSGYHTFGMLWKPNMIAFTVDGQEIVRNTFNGTFVTQSSGGIAFNSFNSNGVWPFNKPFFLILNNAVDPNASGQPNGTTAKMSVDWIRYSSYAGYGTVNP
ncbi:MAG: glycoside hydrolase family 16 protein [Actinobacteria bacterium]|nr:glycoside hydrolase family 16 protein [Actinomycetota bacterium]